MPYELTVTTNKGKDGKSRYYKIVDGKSTRLTNEEYYFLTLRPRIYGEEKNSEGLITSFKTLEYDNRINKKASVKRPTDKRKNSKKRVCSCLFIGFSILVAALYFSHLDYNT